ncbi:MAG: 30S ribosomal protein S12 methylthiotransferase RimO [Lachnospiraceae bacterium]|nr:30S ribosomal protein S12 methylthiotransferase RimO [Candidatus Minthocola equi]
MTVFLTSLGCDKNLCDSEVMLGILSRKGYSFTDVPENADIIIVNSCSFIGDAQEESINTIIDLARHKVGGRCLYLIVTGCLAERFKDEFLEELPEVDAAIGTTAYSQIGDVIARLEAGEKKIRLFKDISLPMEEQLPRICSTGGHFAYIKIAEGCNKRCTYCAIPGIRGSYRSVPIPEILRQAKEYAEIGVKELILVAQETAVHGQDIYGKKSLPELIRQLEQIERIRWIRLLYCYPEEISDELIDTFATSVKLVHYIDMPIQHASDAVLRRMGRCTNRAELTERIANLRKAVPDIAIRTTLIAGFPGESEEDFNADLDFIREIRFDRLGVFAYSQEDGTPAGSMPDQIPQEVKEARRDAIMRLQQEISSEIAASMIGKQLTAFIEGYIPDDEIYVARTYRDAPDVDGLFFVKSSRTLMSGDMITAVVTASSEYDLYGEEIV